MSHKIAIIFGARPNFMKVAPVYRELSKAGFKISLIHTGQHYDPLLSDVFFEDLSLPPADFHLDVGSAQIAVQLSEIIKKLSAILPRISPDLAIVAGDVTSTLAGALGAKLYGIPLAHIEAGLRSFDDSMPEEINRRLTDSISDLLFATENSGMINLRNENCRGKAVLVGNTMIDTLLSLVERSKLEFPRPSGKYAVATFHRPENVDRPDVLERIIFILDKIGEEMPVYFPVHPRTQKNIGSNTEIAKHIELSGTNRGLQFVEPMQYRAFLSLMSGASLVLTDSGGVQEETTVLGVPCLTLRENTERPVTVEFGTNRIVGTNPETVIPIAKRILDLGIEKKGIPPLWDGRASERIAGEIVAFFEEHK